MHHGSVYVASFFFCTPEDPRCRPVNSPIDNLFDFPPISCSLRSLLPETSSLALKEDTADNPFAEYERQEWYQETPQDQRKRELARKDPTYSLHLREFVQMQVGDSFLCYLFEGQIQRVTHHSLGHDCFRPDVTDKRLEGEDWKRQLPGAPHLRRFGHNAKCSGLLRALKACRGKGLHLRQLGRKFLVSVFPPDR